MSGETESSVSGWTVDTLREHVLRLLSDDRRLLDERYASSQRLLDERYATQTKALDAAFKAAEAAVDRALASAEKAVSKAEAAAERRFEGVNEFRQTLTDQAATFLTRAEGEARLTALSKELDEQRRLMERNTGRDEGVVTARMLVFSLIAAVGVLVGVYVALRP